MSDHHRRRFLSEVGRGMLVASVGSALATDLGIVGAWADEVSSELSFGKHEPLVVLMQETPVDRLQPLVVEQIRQGTDLRTLTTAAALANARTFGGQDYTGYHTMMALMPALEMSLQMPTAQRALPVLKVLYRNTDTIQSKGGRKAEVLRPVAAKPAPARGGGQQLRKQVHAADLQAAEATLAGLTDARARRAFNALQRIVQDDINVHRVVLAWRAWDMLRLTGAEHAHTMLRQSVRFCVDAEQERIRNGRAEPAIRGVLPALLDQYKLAGRAPGDRQADDQWVSHLAQTIYNGTREQAAEAAAAALAEGFSPEQVGEAMSLAAAQLVLHDPGQSEVTPGRPKGSVHGASVGVHASDAASAWRHIGRVTNSRNQIASLIVGAYHTAGQAGGLHDKPYPHAEHVEAVRTSDSKELLGELESCIRGNDQGRACALVERYAKLEQPVRPVFDVLLKYAVSEDGALHAEKYFRTVSEEYDGTRDRFRWQHLVALARVTASEYGQPAPGHAQAVELLSG